MARGKYIFDFTTGRGTFYIADAIAPRAGIARHFVLVTSPKAQRYKELAKAPGIRLLCMPI